MICRQGIVSNSDCYEGSEMDDSSSIYISSPEYSLLNAGLKSTRGSAADIKFEEVGDFVVIPFTSKCSYNYSAPVLRQHDSTLQCVRNLKMDV